MPEKPFRIERGDPIPASWLRQVADAIVQRITINHGRVQRIGSSIAIQVDVEGGPRGLPRVYKATTDESGGTIQAKLVDSTGATTGTAVTLIVLP